MIVQHLIIKREPDGSSNVDWISGDYRGYQEMGGDLSFWEWAQRAYPEYVEVIDSQEFQRRIADKLIRE